MSSRDRAILASLFCPAGRLCDCRHDKRLGPYDCRSCKCTCPLPDPYERDDDPDGCACCGELLF